MGGTILGIVKDILEITYYIAFIVLTCLIVWYAKKTFDDQTKQVSTLYFKLYVPADQLGYYEQIVFLEIYNHGTRPANNIRLSIGGKELVTIDYIKPNGTASLPIGEVLRMLGCNRVYIQGAEISKDAIVKIEVSESDTRKTYELNTSSLFIRSEVLHNGEESMPKELRNINETLKKAFDCHHVGPGHNTFRDELCQIAKNIGSQNN